MSKVRICFLGTPDFAVVSLKALLADDHFQVVGVVSQPDRPAGRKMVLTPSPVKILAMTHGIPVITPESVNKDFILDQIKSWMAEVAVVVAFGQILSSRFLGLFPMGAVNVHGSLLPRWRGAAPIQRSLQAGDTETGVALQKVVKELDAGDVLGVRKIQLDRMINAQELHDRLAIMGADLLQVELMDYMRGNLVGVAQNSEMVTYAKKIEKSEGLIDWSISAEEIHNKIRAFVMGPGTWIQFQGKKLKIHKTDHSEQKGAAGIIQALDWKGEEALVVGTSKGCLIIYELQPESRNKMSVKDFLKGYLLKVGDKLQ
jgi:methionyl-tRNA formyltransferase